MKKGKKSNRIITLVIREENVLAHARRLCQGAGKPIYDKKYLPA